MAAQRFCPFLFKTLLTFASTIIWQASADAEEKFPFDMDFSLHGYYRVRGVSISNLANEDRPPIYYNDEELGKDIKWPYTRISWANYLIQRARLEPQVAFGKWAKLHLAIDALDNVVWGDNDAHSSVPLMATNGTTTDFKGYERDTIELRQAWLELDLKVGQLRIGRMRSHWGMGLISHGGGSFDGHEGYQPRDFGDYYYGSVYDRILFATKPLAIIKYLRGDPKPESNFLFAYAYTKLVEDPLELDRPRAFYRPIGESGFLGTEGDDVQDHAFVLAYRNENVNRWAATDKLEGGLYVLLRTQSRSREEEILDSDGSTVIGHQYVGDGSLIHTYDLWLKTRLGALDFETEWALILGHTDGGIPFGRQELLQKDIRIVVGATRAGYIGRNFDGIFEIGYSSGDDTLADETFTHLGFQPDYKVGLLLFEHILAERTARTVGRHLFSGLRSNGSVFNATYMFPRARYRPFGWLEGILGVLLAWRNVPTEEGGLYDAARGSFLGWEVDAALKAHWAEKHLFFAVESGFLFFGDALKDPFLIEGTVGSFTIQGRLAFQF